MPYDKSEGEPGRSKEVDAIAHEAVKTIPHDKSAKVNAADPVNTHQSDVQGNPDASSYNRSRKLGG